MLLIVWLQLYKKICGLSTAILNGKHINTLIVLHDWRYYIF